MIPARYLFAVPAAANFAALLLFATLAAEKWNAAVFDPLAFSVLVALSGLTVANVMACLLVGLGISLRSQD